MKYTEERHKSGFTSRQRNISNVPLNALSAPKTRLLACVTASTATEKLAVVVLALKTVFGMLRCFVWQKFSAPMMGSESTSETSVNFYQTTRRNNPEDSQSPSCSPP
jgi:hypothetical protein